MSDTAQDTDATETRPYRFTATLDRSFDGTQSVQYDDNPEKWIHLGGNPVELTNDQFQKLSRYIVLREVEDGETEPALEPEVEVLSEPGASTSGGAVETAGDAGVVREGEPSLSTATTPPDYNGMSDTSLRELGKDREIPRYSVMERDELIAALENYDQNHQGV